ncbi:MAG: hypothetical protein H6907_17280 [Hyphomicrobiales bacterium]|nr:hypothetical protein [Hyphomicrobiales bacterium]
MTEKQLRAAVQAGARRWTEVLAHHGYEPDCECCDEEIAAHIRAMGEEAPRS